MFTRHYKVWPKSLPKSLRVPATSVHENLAISARRYPDQTAIVYYDTPMTYTELHSEVEALAAWLQQQGVSKGDRVLLYMQNSPQFVIGYYAIMRADAVVVPVNPMSRTAELEHYVGDTGAAVCLAAQELASQLEPLLGNSALQTALVTAYSNYIREPTSLNLPEVVADSERPLSHPAMHRWLDAINAAQQPSASSAGPDDLALMPYSSGTTGAPKGCMHTHRAVMATAVHRVVWTQGLADSVSLACLPLFHVTGMQGAMNGPVYSGSTMVIMTRWDRDVAGELISRYKVTGWPNIVTMVIDFLSNPRLPEYDISSLKSVGGGGAAMPGSVADKLRELTGLDYVEGYGLSETIAATHINPPEQSRPQCLGIPVFDVDSRVVSLESLEELPVGEVGEIIIHGPQVMQGYWQRPEENASVFIELDGKRFLRTGDLGYYDEDGYFYLVDRVKRMINASGFKVWPTEVETLMYRHPAVRECCIVSTPSAKRGETVKAFVVKNAGAEEISVDALQAWCREMMSSYKVPQIIEFVDAIPKSPTGKLMWRQLQDSEWGRD